MSGADTQWWSLLIRPGVARKSWCQYDHITIGVASRPKTGPDAAIILANRSGHSEVRMSRALRHMNSREIRLTCHLLNRASCTTPDDAIIRADCEIVDNKHHHAET